MKKSLILLLLTLLFTGSSFAQSQVNAYFDRLAIDQADPERAWADLAGGVRSVHVTDDLDGDGKVEILATDYSNGGRVHVLEYVDSETLELVWSSPAGLYDGNPNSTPRWVQSGDLDNDGNKEIIFPAGPRYDGMLYIYEYKGADNDYGTETILDFTATAFSAQGVGDFRMDRERGTVYDFDGDGQSELIMANADQKVYIISINGDAPGFASWQIEGGDTNSTTNRFSGGSWWHSVPADINGDDDLEIVNHYWNFQGFWSVDVLGANSYQFPAQGNPGGDVFGPTYYEFFRTRGVDAVGFMGVAVADVDGDGKDEIASITYPTYDLTLVSQPAGNDGINIWDDSTKFSILKGIDDYSTRGQYWGCYAFDFNDNGRDEILVGGFFEEQVVAVEYNGSGDILDGANYDATLVYAGEAAEEEEWVSYTVRDSAGVQWTDYHKAAWLNPGVMKMSHGDINGDTHVDLVLAYQSNAYDSTEITYETWDGSAWVEDSVVTVGKEKNWNIRVITNDPGTGVYEAKQFDIVTPDDYELGQNYPNPFNPTTTIRFSLPLNKEISLVVYDMLGKEVRTLIASESYNKGSYEILWDGTNNIGERVASGNYIYSLKAGNYTVSKKMTLLK